MGVGTTSLFASDLPGLRLRPRLRVRICVVVRPRWGNTCWKGGNGHFCKQLPPASGQGVGRWACVNLGERVAVGCWLLAVGFWLLAVDCWLLAVQ